MRKTFAASGTRKAPALAAAMLFLAIAAAGCSEKASPLPDVTGLGELTVIAREEGSGTRTEFESLVDTTESGTDAVAASTEEMAAFVARDINSIGYIASSTVIPPGVKTITVAGVAATSETIKDGKYPLCRNYYLAYQSDLSDAANDFLTYVMRAGQEVVSGYCVAVDDPAAFLSDKSSGTIRINGSTSAAPILENLAREYVSRHNPNATIEINATDSAAGLTAAMRGECDFGMSSRELKDYEDELLEKKAIGRDGISIIVNAENPVDNLSVKQIKGIYDRTWEYWNEVS